MEEIIEKLKNVGFTLLEAKVYFFLLQYKEAKAGIISQKTNIPSSHIYNTLTKLLEKGVISYKIVNNVKVYRTINPESLMQLILEKEKQIEKEKNDLKKFISTLKNIEIKDKKENDFKYYEGFNGVKSMFHEFINSWEENSDLYIYSASIAYEKWNAFLLDYFHPPRIKKKVNQKLIVPNSLKQHGKERKNLKFIDIRYTKEEPETEFGVSGDYVYFLSQGEKIYSLLIKDKNLAQTQIKIFKVLWDNCKN